MTALPRILVGAIAVVALSVSGSGPEVALSAQRTDPLRMYDDALRSIQRGDVEIAVQLLEQAIRRRPDPSDRVSRGGMFEDTYYPYFYLARAYHLLNRPEDALRFLEDSLGRKELSRDSQLQAERTQIIRQLQLQVNLNVNPADPSDSIEVADDIPFHELYEAGQVTINGEAARVTGGNQERRTVQFLGQKSGLIQQGVNLVKTKTNEWWVWVEGRRLSRFENPYQNSFAVVVAIGDYERKGTGGPPVGYISVPGMIDRARDLMLALEGVGFPRANIIPLLDAQATSRNVDQTLRDFWQGGKHAGADRLFIYFGGHGDVSTTSNAPFLVTYDFDSLKPTATSVLMRNLTQIHANEIVAKHVLIALDACHSGLAGPKTLDREPTEDDVKRFRRLSVIKGDTESNAKQVLVAGTGNEKALYENGGVFTSALVDGLRGRADWNRDGIIQFQELAMHIRNEVIAQAARSGVEQRPTQYSLGGEGQFMFVVPKSAPR